MFFPLPRTATAPFCPSEVKGSVAVPQSLPFGKKLMRYAGPAEVLGGALGLQGAGFRRIEAIVLGLVGTIAGQIIMEGFLDLKIPCWQRRLLTRALALVPAFLGVRWFGERRRGQDARAEPGGAELSAAVCDVAAHSLHEQPRDGQLRQRPGAQRRLSAGSASSLPSAAVMKSTKARTRADNWWRCGYTA
jgi:hypothetical protein